MNLQVSVMKKEQSLDAGNISKGNGDSPGRKGRAPVGMTVKYYYFTIIP